MDDIHATGRPQGREVADIFRLYGEAYRRQNGMTPKQHKVMTAIANCRSSACGTHIDVCENCGHLERHFNSCRDRHCPKCQAIASRKWVGARLKEILPVPYYHVVFTLPHLLHKIILYNRALIYNLLFSSASETLLTFGRDPRWLGGQIGFYGILHTWGQTLWQHPHIHFMVPGGALSAEGRWIKPRHRGRFLFPVHALSKVFRGKFIHGLRDAYHREGLIFPPDESHLRGRRQFDGFLDRLAARGWIVYCKRPFEKAHRAIKYIGRYTHRVAISNRRIARVEDNTVEFRYKDYKAYEARRWKTMKLDALEFIRRFLWHILPAGFHKIRYYGFLSNGRSKSSIGRIRDLLGSENVDIDLAEARRIACPECGVGTLKTLIVFGRFGGFISAAWPLFTQRCAFDTS